MKKVVFIEAAGLKTKVGFVGKLCLILSIVAGAVAIPLLPLHQPRSQAASLWMDGVTLAEEPITASLVNRGNLECEYFSPSSKYVSGYTRVGDPFSGQVVFSDSTVESFGRTYADVCLAQNEHGLMNGRVWVPEGNAMDDAYPIDTSFYSMLPAPGGSAMLFMRPAPTIGTQYSINHNLLHIGKLDVKLIGSGASQKSERIWKIDSSKLDSFLSYGDGQVVRIIQVGFSSNGKYMVAQIANRGMVLIDLYSKEMTPFLINDINAISGGEPDMTVSNDGRFVATYSSGKLEVHDLQGCQNTYQYGQWPSDGALQTQGCATSPNFFFNQIRTAYPSSSNIGRLRFSPNAASLYVDVGWRVLDDMIWKRVRLDAVGYVSQARGYLAMGDSFSSGEGDTEGGTWYEPGTDEQGDINTFAGRNLCHLSRRSYPYLLAVEVGYLANNASTPEANGLFHSVACSGAKMHNITGLVGEKQNDGNASEFTVTDNQYRYDVNSLLKLWQPGATAQQNFVTGTDLTRSAVSRSGSIPEAITLSIGGNDAGFGEKLLACLKPGICEVATNESARSAVAIELAAEKGNLVRTYGELKQAAPESRIYVIGYPQFVQASGETCAANVHLEGPEREFVVNATSYFNLVIEAAAKEAGVTYVNVTDILGGTNLCSLAPDAEKTVNGVTAGNDIAISFAEEGPFKYGICGVRNCIGKETFHPNQAAQPHYRERILRETQALTKLNPLPEPTSTPLPSAYFGLDAQAYVNGVNGNYLTPYEVEQLHEMVIGAIGYRSPQLNLQSLLPSSIAQVEVRSIPTSLGSYTVGMDGVLNISVTIPESIAGGYHEIHVTAINALGKRVHYYQPIMVAERENDFDGDAVSNETDSCPTISNSGTDIDEDGIDDACDERPQAPVIVPPEAPGAPDLLADSDSGVSQGDNLTNHITPSFAVSCVDNNVVAIYEGDVELGNGTCVDGAAAITSITLAEGDHALHAIQKDAKSSSEPSQQLSVTIDTSEPDIPYAPDLDFSSDTGGSSTDNRTSDTTPTLTGACDSTEVDLVTIFVDGVPNTHTNCINDIYLSSTSSLQQGTRNFTVSFADRAGNSSQQSQVLVVTIAPDEEPDDEGCMMHPVKDQLKCKLKKIMKYYTWVFTTPHKESPKVHMITNPGNVSIPSAMEREQSAISVN